MVKHPHQDTSVVAQMLTSSMLKFSPQFDKDPARATRLFGDSVGADYIPAAVRSRMDYEFYVQFCVLLQVIDQVLEEILPSANQIRRELGPRLQHYHSKGGKVEHVLDYLLSSVMDHFIPLDFPEADKMKDTPGWDALPSCANDVELRLVRYRLGLTPEIKWGPYKSSTGFHNRR